MGKMGDFLTEKQKIEYINSKIKPGNILHLFCDFTRPPKEKFVVLVHSSSEPKVVAFLINTKIHEFIEQRESLLKCQVKIYPSDYPFLKHKSHVDCATVVHFNKPQIATQILSDKDRTKGSLKQVTKNKIIKVVNNAKTISKHYKQLIMKSLK